MSKAGTMRLQKEYKTMSKDFETQLREHGKVTEMYVAAPNPDNIFEWYFIIFGFEEEPYKGGYYMGKLNFPDEYPWKPPSIRMMTETGRLTVNERICLSISDYHPESWNPIWPVASIIIGLISFFITDLNTLGAVSRTKAERMKICKESANVIKEHKIYKELFRDEFAYYIGLESLPPPVKEEITQKEEEKQGKQEHDETKKINISNVDLQHEAQQHNNPIEPIVKIEVLKIPSPKNAAGTSPRGTPRGASPRGSNRGTSPRGQGEKNANIDKF